MSFLAPLYVLGALAVVAPIVFHLIRRSPQGEVPFSSLMFLSPTPPRLTRRSRLEDWLLLLLRAAALCLLAFAFARPFLRQPAQLDAGSGGRERVIVLVDTSASMRRGDLWTRARRAAEEAIAKRRPEDQLAVFAFDTSARPLLGFAESETLDAARRRTLARDRIERESPTWRGTDLGQALIEAIGRFDDVSDRSESAGRAPRRIVLVSDLQEGSRLESLRLFEWPKDVLLDLKTLAVQGDNAGLERLADAAQRETDGGDLLRVRVSNDAGSKTERFRLQWQDRSAKAIEKGIDAYVPAGESRVVRVPMTAARNGGAVLQLVGDAHPFDNALYITHAHEERTSVLYVGDDKADQPAGLLYYLQRAFETSRERIQLQSQAGLAPLEIESPKSVAVVILSSPVSQESVVRLRGYLEEGGTVLLILRDGSEGETLASLAGEASGGISEARVDGDAMLGEIAFDHPLFAPFAGAQYNDFTKIRFWKYRKIDGAALSESRVLARFENGDPAVIEKRLGGGRLLVLASGWSPADSQLARSSKFVPLLKTMALGRSSAAPGSDLVVGEPAALGVETAAVVQKPDGTREAVAAGEARFTDTSQPGVYTVEGTEPLRKFAVNVDPSETRTAPLSNEALEQLGCRLAGRDRSSAAEAAERQRQMRSAELESRQKLWRWLILGAVAVLILETWLSGRKSRPAAREEVVAA